jgi:hypothetical protein
MIFPVVESVVLQGYLRFPQVFWMVFCGEFVVVGWWNRGFLQARILVGEIFLGFRIYFLGG